MNNIPESCAVKLTLKQKDMLVELKKYFAWGKELDFENKFNCVILTNLDEDNKTHLRELCSEYLVEVGFSDDYILNEKGAILEELIDKLYV